MGILNPRQNIQGGYVMKKNIFSILAASLFIFTSGLTACAKTTQPYKGVAYVAPASTTRNWKAPFPEHYWKGGEKKSWAQVRRGDGKLVWVSFQNAPKRKVKNLRCGQDDWHFSVAWRTDKDSHPGESDVQYGHVGVRCYGNTGQCPPTAGEAWQNVLRLINESQPPLPKNWEPNMVFGPWLGSCN